MLDGKDWSKRLMKIHWYWRNLNMVKKTLHDKKKYFTQQIYTYFYYFIIIIHISALSPSLPMSIILITNNMQRKFQIKIQLIIMSRYRLIDLHSCYFSAEENFHKFIFLFLVSECCISFCSPKSIKVIFISYYSIYVLKFWNIFLYF